MLRLCGNSKFHKCLDLRPQPLLSPGRRILSVEGHERIMAPLLDDFPPVQHHDQVAVAQCGETVGDDQDGPVAVVARQACQDCLFGPGIHGGEGVVEDENGRVLEECPGNGGPLLLPAGQGHAPFTHESHVAVGQTLHVGRQTGHPGGCLDLLPRCSRVAVADVVGNGAGEQEALLGDEADGIPQLPERDHVDIRAVDEKHAVRHRIEARDELRHGGLAASQRADDADFHPFVNGKGDILQDQAGFVLSFIGKREISEFDLTPYSVDIRPLGRVGDGGPCLEDVVEARHGGCPALHEVEDPPHHDGWPDKHCQVAVECDEVAKGQFTGDDPASPHEKDDEGSQSPRGGHDGDHEAAQPGYGHVARQIALADAAE